MNKIQLMILFTGLFLTSFAQQEVLTWSDEFDGSGAPDPTKWSYDLGAGGWGNNEIQTYTNSLSNCRQEGGMLIISALKMGNTWTSARIITNNKEEFRYGRVVFRAKLPTGAGTWPALWMLGENFATKGWPACGEIDVMEHVGKNPGYVRGSIHSPSSFGNTVNTKTTQISTFSTEFHTYMVNWTYSKVEFFVDSVKFYTYSPSVRNIYTWPLDHPFFIIMNIAMGGNMGSDPRYETLGKKDGVDPALTSARMEIDYVRVYQYPAGTEEPGMNDTQGNSGKPTFFPNPAQGSIRVKTPTGKTASCNIYNLTGTDVFRFQTNGNEDIDISSLPKGLYFLAMKSDGKTFTEKLILQ